MAEIGFKRPHSKNSTKFSSDAGVLLFSGLTDYHLRDEKPSKNPSIKFSAHTFKSLEGIRIRDVSSSPTAYFFLAISDNGKVYSWGSNERGQLGLGDCHNRRNPTLMESMSEHNVVHVATGRKHCLMVTDKGDVYACGDNKSGQCGLGTEKDFTCNPIWIDVGCRITSAACGDAFSLLLSENGKVLSFGSSENGQLGNGVEEVELIDRAEYFVPQYTPTEIDTFIEVEKNGMEFSHGQPFITRIEAGPKHACAIDELQRLFTWGFGGYGRLGHNETRDEHRPRLIKTWYHAKSGRVKVTNVWCGGQFNIVEVDRCLFMFGQFHPRIHEANMYPKLMEDLQGWNIRHACCSQTGFTICADDFVIGAQTSHAYGMLAMGEFIKSSAKAMILTCFKNVYCLRGGLGYMHACFIVRDSSEKDTKAIGNFPELDFDDTVVEEEEDEEVEEEVVRPQKSSKAKTKSKGKGKTAAKKKKR